MNNEMNEKYKKIYLKFFLCLHGNLKGKNMKSFFLVNLII